MKKLAIVLGLMLFCIQGVLADEVLPQQTIKNEQSYFTANLQKQPPESRQKQGITNHFTFFTINVQINGKTAYERRTETGNSEYSDTDRFNAGSQTIKDGITAVSTGE